MILEYCRTLAELLGIDFSDIYTAPLLGDSVKSIVQFSLEVCSLLGALAPGVNGPTWNTLRSAFVMLGVCLVVMLGLAFSSSDSWLIIHVAFLVLIAASLFFLLTWFLSEVGLVSVEHQMKELDLVPNDHKD
ncbi:hypothetical protein M5689_008833 [Euphorbia peplus]|nr:hypothetical protein M5689_008833 [Euphorbia peplus]